LGSIGYVGLHALNIEKGKSTRGYYPGVPKWGHGQWPTTEQSRPAWRGFIIPEKGVGKKRFDRKKR